MALITCLKGETSALREGCSGFFNSVSEVVATYAAQASDQFRDEEDEQDIDTPPSTSGGGSTVVSNAPTPAPPCSGAPDRSCVRGCSGACRWWRSLCLSPQIS